MARPQRNNVDYFPHECIHGRKMFIIESKYGNDGYAVWFKMLEQIGVSENHYLDLRDETQRMYLASIMRVDQGVFESILLDLSKIGAINEFLYTKHNIVWSDKFVESIQDAYSRRNNKCMTYEGLCNHLSIKCSAKPNKRKPTVSNNPQSIVKDTKEEEIKEYLHPFLIWFNSKKKEFTGKEGRHKMLSSTDLKNLKKLKEVYDTKDFEHAIKFLFKNEWVKNTNNLTPTHFLRNDNFNKYYQSEEVSTEKGKGQGGVSMEEMYNQQGNE